MNSELIEFARLNCNEKFEKNKRNIAEIIDWIRKTPHLKARPNERLILAFLRRSHFHLNNAKRYIDWYYSFKNLFPEVLRERFVDESLLELKNSGIHIIKLQPIDSAGPRLIISRFSHYDGKKFHSQQIFKLFFMLLEILALEDNNATIFGISYVIDVRNVSMDQMLQYDPFLVKKLWMFVERGLPLKIHEIHIINMRREYQSVLNFATNYLPIKMPFKYLVHQKAEELYKHIPRDAMTIEYGGHNGFAKEAIKVWTQKLKDYKQYFNEDDNYGTNEKLRATLINHSNKCEELEQGINGSFRKVPVD